MIRHVQLAAATTFVVAMLVVACGSPATPATPGTPATMRASTISVTLAPNTSDPYAGLPSAACGGVHVRVTNNRDTSAVIHINDTYELTVKPHDEVVVIEMLVEVPMPWNFVVTDAQTGETLYTSNMSGPLGHEITLEPTSPSIGPSERPLGGCLQE